MHGPKMEMSLDESTVKDCGQLGKILIWSGY